LIPGAGGVFDVLVDGSLTYSKHATGEFPDEQILIDHLKTK
jgi:predicted Rdx family selenoprotein